VFRAVQVPLVVDRPRRGEDEADQRRHDRQKQHAVVRAELGDLAVVDGDYLVSDLVEQEGHPRGQQAHDQQFGDDKQGGDVGAAAGEEDGEGDPEGEPRHEEVPDLGRTELVAGDPVAEAHVSAPQMSSALFVAPSIMSREIPSTPPNSAPNSGRT